MKINFKNHADFVAAAEQLTNDLTDIATNSKDLVILTKSPVTKQTQEWLDKVAVCEKESRSQITVRKRAHDYIAYFEDSPARWECGKDDIDALGKLLISTLDRLNCYIYWYNERGELV